MAIPSLFRLDGKVAVVTGGYGGIGLAICREIAAAGGRVAVAGHHEDKAAASAESLRGEGADARAAVFDARSVGDIQRMVDEVAATSAGSTSWSTASAGSAKRRRTRSPKRTSTTSST